MTLFSFPAATLEKAPARRMLTLEPAPRARFCGHRGQKPYRKAFIEKKALPLMAPIAGGWSWSGAGFGQEAGARDVNPRSCTLQSLQPPVQSESMLQLMQKKVQPEPQARLLAHMESYTLSGAA